MINRHHNLLRGGGGGDVVVGEDPVNFLRRWSVTTLRGTESCRMFSEGISEMLFGSFLVMVSGDSIGSNELSLSFDEQARKQWWVFVRQWIV